MKKYIIAIICIIAFSLVFQSVLARGRQVVPTSKSTQYSFACNQMIANIHISSSTVRLVKLETFTVEDTKTNKKLDMSQDFSLFFSKLTSIEQIHPVCYKGLKRGMHVLVTGQRKPHNERTNTHHYNVFITSDFEYTIKGGER